MCFSKIVKSKITEFSMTSNELKTLLNPLGLSQTYLWDGTYYFCSHDDWGKVFENVLSNLPKYTAEKFDCDNYSLLVSARVSSEFKLNTCGIAIGQSPMGYHGFNIFISDLGVYYLEPQNGIVYNAFEDSGYKAELVIFG